MSFTEELRREADPIFEALYKHPFIQGIAEGNLQKEQLIHYTKQDFEYLNVYIQIYGLGISKSKTREDMAMFKEKIDFILHSEIHPHHNFCRVAGVDYDDLQGFPLAPTALHYTRHMLTVANQGTLGELMAVLLACPWTYLAIGQELIRTIKPDPSHPFYEWIMFYGDEAMGKNFKAFRDRLDREAEKASEEEKMKMKEHFITSCQLEYMFFSMAYNIEEWPVPVEKEVVV
jgi:thiaminase/transcriptional activator TenA